MLLFCLAAPSGARAQATASVSLESDYRYRGISLSNGRPSFAVNAAFDHSSGFYAGGSAIAQDTEHQGVQMLGFVEYLGYAIRPGGNLSFDVGVNNQDYHEYNNRRYDLHYSEVYAGVVKRNVSLHLYYSPNYAQSGWNALYTDLSGAFRPADKWRLFGHVGILTPVNTPVLRQRYDLRAGVAREFRNFEIHAAVIAITPNPPLQTPQRRTTLVAGATYFF